MGEGTTLPDGMCSAPLWSLASCSAFSRSTDRSCSRSNEHNSIRGRVIRRNSAETDNLLVEFWPENGTETATRTVVSSDGGFETAAQGWSSSGSVKVVVLNAGGREIHQETVSMTAATADQPLVIRLPKPADNDDLDETASLEDLRRRPGYRFRTEIRRAEQALSRSELDETAEHLARAAALEPSRVEVHTRLGVLLLQTNDHEGALASFDQSAALGAESETTQIGRAMALRGLGRLHAAERQARIAVAAYPESARCRYALVLILDGLGLHTDGVVAHIKRAEAEYPQACLVAARVYNRRGEHQKAERALRRSAQTHSEPSERPAA